MTRVILKKINPEGRSVSGTLIGCVEVGRPVIVDIDGTHEYVTTPLKRALEVDGTVYFETINSRYSLTFKGF